MTSTSSQSISGMATSYNGRLGSLCTTKPVVSMLSGIPEFAFSSRFGSLPTYMVQQWTEAIRVVYIVANYNALIEKNGGSLPNYPTTVFSDKLVEAIMNQYRSLSASGTVKHLTGETITTNDAKAVYEQVQLRLLRDYPNISYETVRTVLRTFFYQTLDGKIDAKLITPNLEVYPTPGGQQMQANQNAQRSAEEMQKAAEEEKNKNTFLGQMGAALINVFKAPGEFAAAASTTAKVVGIGGATVLVVGVGFLVYTIGRKIIQLNVNNVVTEQGKTARVVGKALAPAAAKAITKGAV